MRLAIERLASLRALAIGAFGLLAFAYLTVPAVDPDYGWHVANGRHLLDGVLLGGVDVYSWTAHGATWIAHEWATEGVMAALNDSLGATANSVVAGVLATVALLLTLARLRRRGFGTIVVLVVGVLALLNVGTLVSVGPAAVEVLGLALVLWLVEAWRGRAMSDRRFALAAIATLLGWANAHGSFVLGLGVLGATWIELAWTRDPRARTALGVAVAGTAVTLLNPFGARLWAYVLEAGTGSRLQLITEWAPPDLAKPMWWAFVAALALCSVGIVGSVAGRSRGPGSRGQPLTARAVRLDDMLIGLAVAILGLDHARHAGILGIAAAPLIAAGLAVLVPREPGLGGRAVASSGRVNVTLLAGMTVAVITLAWARVGAANTAAATRADYPVDALPALDALACGRPTDLRLFNDYAWGGWLEMTRPAVPVFIDGRSEVFGDAGVARYALIAGAQPGWDTSLDAAGVTSALIRSDGPLVAALEGKGWTVVHQDMLATLLRQSTGVDTGAGGCIIPTG